MCMVTSVTRQRYGSTARAQGYKGVDMQRGITASTFGTQLWSKVHSFHLPLPSI